MSTTTDVLSLFKYDPVADADSTFNITQGLNNNWDKIDTALLLAIAAAGAYNPEESYAVGDYCTYKGKLRKCSTAIPTGETWTEAHWTTTTVAAELAELSSQLSNLATPPQEYDLHLAAGVVLRDGATYWKDNVGMVGVNGTISLGNNMAPRMAIGTLPVGYRPASNKSGILVSASGAAVPVSVYPIGGISIGVDSLPAGLTSTEWCRLIVPAFPAVD